MPSRRGAFRMDHPVIVTFLVIAVVASMSLAAEVLKPLALAVLLSFALAPLVGALERRRLPRGAAVVLTVLLALGALGGIGYIVGRQLTALADQLPEYEDHIREKLTPFKTKEGQKSALSKANKVVQDVAKDLGSPPIEADVDGEGDKIQKVKVVEQPTWRARLQTAVGPYLEFVGVGSFVLILVLFMLLHREDLADRIIRLFGSRQVSLTTRTMAEVGARVSRYLATFAAVNSTFGLIVGLGLWAIGVPYAALWGVLAAGLRFIPYVGPATAAILPILFSVAYFPGNDWVHPALVIGLFGVMEVAANSFLEPVIYGKTTGVSALGLLVAAMFWTWLWGALGLLLSTPLTVCLAVLGKYVPSLGFFSTLLGEEPALEPDVKFYQRLLAGDQDGADQIVEEQLAKRPRAEVFDQMLVPVLSRAERDFARQEIDESDQALVWRVVGEVLDDLEGAPDLSLDAIATRAEPAPSAPAKVVGVAANDAADALVLRMLGLLLRPADVALEVIAETASPLKLADAVADHEPEMAVLSHLPPVGLAPARYLVRKLHARLPDLSILVGRWGEGGDTDEVAGRLTAAGASGVAFGLAEARDRILRDLLPKPAEPSPALAGIEKS